MKESSVWKRAQTLELQVAESILPEFSIGFDKRIPKETEIESVDIERYAERPTWEEFRSYIHENKIMVNAKQEYDRLESNGWKDKNGYPLKDWKKYYSKP